MAKVVALEAAAIGVNQVFAPVADVARELRYGRVCVCNFLLSSCNQSLT
jgi:beta-glucosidase